MAVLIANFISRYCRESLLVGRQNRGFGEAVAQLCLGGNALGDWRNAPGG